MLSEEIQNKILKRLYEKTLETKEDGHPLIQIGKEIEINDKSVIENAEKLEKKGFLRIDAIGGGNYFLTITTNGMEHVQNNFNVEKIWELSPQVR